MIPNDFTVTPADWSNETDREACKAVRGMCWRATRRATRSAPGA